MVLTLFVQLIFTFGSCNFRYTIVVLKFLKITMWFIKSYLFALRVATSMLKNFMKSNYLNLKFFNLQTYRFLTTIKFVKNILIKLSNTLSTIWCVIVLKQSHNYYLERHKKFKQLIMTFKETWRKSESKRSYE